MQLRKAAQPFGRIGDGRHFRPPLAKLFLHGAFEDGDEQVVLAVEVEVDGAGGDAGCTCHVGHLGVEVAAFGEHIDGRAQDRIALGAWVRRRWGGPTARGRGGWHGAE